MRLLSFLNLIENHLGTRRPEATGGWIRRASYHTGSAGFSHPRLGLTLTLRSCLLADGQHNLSASWHGADGTALASQSFFSGTPGFRWERAAEAMTELMPTASRAPSLVSAEDSAQLQRIPA